MLDDDLSPDFDLIELVYEAALHPEKFDHLINAWDASFARTIGLDTAALRLADLEQKGLARHFARAGQIFEATDPGRIKDPAAYITSQRTAALLATVEGKVLFANSMAIDAFESVIGGTLLDLPLDAQSAGRISEIISNLLSSPEQEDTQSAALCGVRQDNEKVFVLVIEKLPANMFQNIEKPTLLVRSTLTRWDERIRTLLNAVFGLTPAELEILEMLNEGLKAEEISNRRGRSLKTVRTQIKVIGQKTRTNSQSELMRHISSLLILAGEIKDTIDARETIASKTERQDGTLELASFGTVHFVDEGPKAAPAVLCFYPTTPPANNAPLEDQLVQAGMRRIAIHKPGSGRTSATSKPLSLKEQADIHQSIAEHLNLNGVIALGHCSGGISALEFARERPELVNAVVLIDTGAPLTRDAQWDAMPASAKRTFFLAKNSPELLHTPHQVVAADFFSGEDGKRRIVNYFYADQGNDLTLLRDPELYRLASEMIAYCLADTEQLIEDVRGWTHDWSGLLQSVCDQVPVTFIHGTENKQFPIVDIKALAATHENVHVVGAEGAAQLTPFTHAELICSVLHTRARQR